MSTALVPYEQLTTMAQAFAKSGMFGAKTPDQALSLLLLAQAEGVHPAIAMRDFDIIQGRPAKKSEAMHRAFLAAGGKIEWHRLDDEMADATFSHENGGTARISWDMARAQKAGLKNKDMYAKYPRQMLKARVISEGCRTVYPAATSGLYVPEEVVHFGPDKAKDMGRAQVVDEDPDITQAIPGVCNSSEAPQGRPSQSPSDPAGASPSSDGEPLISADQHATLLAILGEVNDGERRFKKQAGIERLTMLPAKDYARAIKWAEAARSA